MIEQLFNPNSIAIIGASNDKAKWGNQILTNLINSGFEGDVYPINPKSDIINGLVVYKSILDAPLPIDQVVICVPSVFVADVLKECGEAKIKSVVIISAGFSELGNHELEQEVVDIAEMYDISLVGPNTFGFFCRSSSTNVSLISNM